MIIQWKAEPGSPAHQHIVDFFEERKQILAKAKELSEQLGFESIAYGTNIYLSDPLPETNLKRFKQIRSGFWLMKANSARKDAIYKEFEKLKLNKPQEITQKLIGAFTFMFFGNRLLENVGLTKTENTWVIELHPYQYFHLKSENKLQLAEGMTMLTHPDLLQAYENHYINHFLKNQQVLE